MIYTARVIAGRGEGRRLGFPTINLEIPAGFSEKHGVYAGWAWLDPKKCGQQEARLPAAIHYGPVPTFGIQKASLEVHVIGVDIPKAPPELSFELGQYLREVKDFKGSEALQHQMRNDVQTAIAALEFEK